MKPQAIWILALCLPTWVFAVNTIIMPSDPALQFSTSREYGAPSKLTRTDGKDSVGYSLVEKTDRSSVVFALGNDSVVRTVESIEGLGKGVKVEKQKVRICDQDCEYLNWEMNGYFYGATHLKVAAKNKKKRLVTFDIVAASKKDLQQVESDLATLSLFDAITLQYR